MSMRSRMTAAALGMALLSACTGGGAPEGAGSPSPSSSTVRVTEVPRGSSAPRAAAPPARSTAPSLRPEPMRNRSMLAGFTSCTPLLQRIRTQALRVVGPYGLGFGMYGHGAPFAAPVTSPGGAPGAPPAMAPDSGPTHSTTNNQEAGVDEPDVVQSDGRLLVTLRNDPAGVQVVDVSGATPRLRGFLRLGDIAYGGRLLLVDGRLVVLGPAPFRSTPQPGTPRTAVTVVSLADPDAPRVERELVVEGALVAARAVAGRVLLVLQSAPEIVFAMPKDGSETAARNALRDNRSRVRKATLDDWLPSVTVQGSGRSYRASCGRSYAASHDAGAAMTSVLSVDPASDVPGDHVAVAGSASVVYASLESLYLTSLHVPEPTMDGSPPRVPVGLTTDVHAFDISDPAQPRYDGSGRVDGTVLSQYSMSEHEGHLRVATTRDPTWDGNGTEIATSDNLLTVLRRDAGALAPVGRLTGMGRGERIYGVRFQGDLGYVVTFRQTDPLYVLDLSDPLRPAARGELKVTGYSSYLHPVGDGQLLGIGQEVDPKTLRTMGTQVSVFDVRDPQRPGLRSRQVFPRGWSPVENDPLAFLWWPATRLVVVPLWQHDDNDHPTTFAGAVALRVGASGALTELGRVRHPDPSDDPYSARVPARILVVGDVLVSVFDDGVLTSSLDTMEKRSWSPYR
ncbi:MAG TPA: beta-propeller domain-containing protein [Frankiaceae bacterium]|nr:beta-propeller domain-containing protein [Frankiaceae bacterium]